MRKIQYPRIRASITISAIMPAPSFCLSDKYVISYTILRKSRTPVKYPAVSSFIKRYFCSAGNISIQKSAALCVLYRTFGVYFLVLIRIRSEQQYEQNDRKDKSDRRTGCKSSAQYECTDLVYCKRYHVCKHVLEHDCKPEPLSGLHLLCHRSDRRQTRRVEQIKQQE